MGLQTSAVIYSVRLARQLHGYTARLSAGVGNAEKTLIIKSQTRRILATTLIGIVGGIGVGLCVGHCLVVSVLGVLGVVGGVRRRRRPRRHEHAVVRRAAQQPRRQREPQRHAPGRGQGHQRARPGAPVRAAPPQRGAARLEALCAQPRRRLTPTEGASSAHSLLRERIGGNA